jgi:TP901 family phage tail tape measure protein
MAFTLSTIYKAVDKFSGPMAAMEKANAKFAAAQTKSFTGVKTAFANIRNQIIGLAGNIGAAALIMTGFNAVKDFDESLASLRAITGLTGKAFIPFKKEIMAVGDATKMAYPEVAKAFELIGSAKPELLDNAKAMGIMTKATILLSKSAGMDLTTAAMSLTQAMNQFGVGADKAGMFVDILSTSEQKGTATTKQLVESLVNGGSTAKTLGVSFEDTNAILQGYAKAGVLGSEAGTQMASVLSKLATVTKKEFNPTQVGAVKALDNLAKANLKYTDILKLVGPEKAKFLSTLLNQNEVVQKLSGNLYDVGNAQKQADERGQSFVVRVEQLTAKFKNLVISGNETSGSLNMFGKVLGFVTEHLGLILTVVGSVVAAYGAYYAIMTAIRISTIAWNVVLGINYALQGSYPIALAASTVALTTFNVASKIAAFATGLFSAALWACPITWIIAGILALGAGIFLLVKHWDKVKVAMGSFFTGAWDGIKKFARMILDFMLFPIVMVLKAISKLTGAKWAGDALAGIEKIKDAVSDDEKKEAAKPVNTIKAANDVQIQRNEEVQKNQMELILKNKSNQQVNVSKNTGMIPLTTSTY